MSSLWRGESIYRDKTIPLVYFAGLSKLSLAKVRKTWPRLNLDWRIWGSPIISYTPKGIKYQAVMVSTTAKKSRKKFSWSERKFSTWCRLRQSSEIQTRCLQGVLLGDGTRQCTQCCYCYCGIYNLKWHIYKTPTREIMELLFSLGHQLFLNLDRTTPLNNGANDNYEDVVYYELTHTSVPSLSVVFF